MATPHEHDEPIDLTSPPVPPPVIASKRAAPPIAPAAQATLAKATRNQASAAATSQAAAIANLSLGPCDECGKPISRRARQCPHCGAPAAYCRQAHYVEAVGSFVVRPSAFGHVVASLAAFGLLIAVTGGAGPGHEPSLVAVVICLGLMIWGRIPREIIHRAPADDE